MDDFDASELETSSLRKAPQNGAPEEERDGDSVAPRGTHTSTRRASYWRRIRAIIVGVCVLSVLALVLARSPETPAIVGDMLGIKTPTPTIPLTLGMDKFYPLFSVPWGTLRVDGHVHTAMGQTGQYQPIRLSRGSHVLEYRAAPFPSLRCTISAPAAPSDTCPQVDMSKLIVDPVPQEERGLAREIDLGARPERLPAGQLAALSVAIDSAVREGTIYHTTVIPGERYAVAPDQIAVSSQSLTATLTVKRMPQADNGAGRIVLGGFAPCADICVDTLPGDAGDASSWRLNFTASLGWRYTTADGHVMAEIPLLVLQGPMAGVDIVAQGSVTWEHEQWVVQHTDNNLVGAVCGVAQFLVSNLYNDLSTHETITYAGASSATQISQQEADGCYETYQRQTLDGKHEPEAGFLYRLGVLLAVNAQAQHLFPALPVADAHDREIVSQTRVPFQP